VGSTLTSLIPYFSQVQQVMSPDSAIPSRVGTQSLLQTTLECYKVDKDLVIAIDINQM
jgi:hypothetical protein